MSLTDRHITALMRQIATRNDIELVHPFAELETFGALVYLAECYGFRYESVRLVGKHRIMHVQLVRDSNPWARQRAAANSAAFPTRAPAARCRACTWARSPRSPRCSRRST